MSRTDKVRVVVRSHKVPARIFEYGRPVGVSPGFYFPSASEQRVAYDSIFDAPQLKAIDEAKRLAADLGLPLEIFDEAKANPFRRALTRLVSASREQPSLTLTKSWSQADLRRARSSISAPTAC